MKSWFFSIKGAVALSVIVLLTMLWRSFLDAMFVLPVDFGDETTLNFASVIFTALFAGWAWAILAAAQGSRRGMHGAFWINLLVLLSTPLGWLLFYCPAACRADAGIFNFANTLNLVFGILAALALSSQIWGRGNSNARVTVRGT